ETTKPTMMRMKVDANAASRESTSQPHSDANRTAPRYGTGSPPKALAGAQHPDGLAEPGRLGHESVGRSGVELEHLVVARDGEAGPDVPGQPGRLGTGEVAGHPALRRAAVDGEQVHVEGERPQLLHLTLVPDAVPGVVDREATEARDVSEVPAAAALVALDLLVGGGDGRDAEAGHLDLSAVVEAHRSRRIDLQPL